MNLSAFLLPWRQLLGRREVLFLPRERVLGMSYGHVDGVAKRNVFPAGIVFARHFFARDRSIETGAIIGILRLFLCGGTGSQEG